MEMPKPTAGHEKLKMLEGRWEGQEKMYPSPWAPQGSVATGRTSARLALGGFAIVSDYEQERDGVVTFTGHAVTTFDPRRDLYSLHWFDCIGSPPEVFEGRFEGSKLVVVHGGPMHARLTYDFGDPAALRTRMEMSEDGKSWKPMFDGSYQRKDR